jgi:hypothetical protein
MTGAGSTPKQFLTGLKTLRRADFRDYGNQWYSAYGNTKDFTKSFTGANAELASRLAYNTEAPLPSVSKPSTITPDITAEVQRLMGIHGQDNASVGSALMKYLKGQGRSQSDINAIFKELN